MSPIVAKLFSLGCFLFVCLFLFYHCSFDYRMQFFLLLSPSSIDGKGDSQRNSVEDGFRLEQRPNSMTGWGMLILRAEQFVMFRDIWNAWPSVCLNSLIPVYPGESVAPIRTAKAERRHQDRLRMQSPELAVAMDKELSPAEKRALEAEKRAMWRAARYNGHSEWCVMWNVSHQEHFALRSHPFLCNADL